jgi:DNA-directed RNA polymerase II subunit RPB4
MKKTQDYLTTFARFQTTEAIHAVERYTFEEGDVNGSVLRNDPELHKFEVAQLGSLCPEESEEAKTLIPRYAFFLPCLWESPDGSLVTKKTDEDLQAILDELSSLRKFQ